MQFSASRWHRANAWLANHWFAFLFLLFHRMLCHPTLDDLYSLWSCMDQWLLQPSKQHKLLAPDSAVVQSTALVLKSPFFWRRLSSVSSWAQTLERSSGTRQLRNWCKDAIEIPHTQIANIKVVSTAKWWFPLLMISSYLVDPASSHMLVLKIKPCMSKYKHLYRETENGSLKQLLFIWWFLCYLDNRSNSRANTCTKGRLTKPCIY